MITTVDAALIAIANFIESQALPQVFTKKEAAEFLKVSEASIDNYIAAGTLECFHVGPLVRFTASQLNQFISNNSKKLNKQDGKTKE